MKENEKAFRRLSVALEKLKSEFRKLEKEEKEAMLPRLAAEIAILAAEVRRMEKGMGEE